MAVTEKLAEGTKHDTGKTQVELLPTDGLFEIAKVLTFGAQKYAPRNWEKGIKYSRVYGAALRHLFAWWGGQRNDPETGIHHLAHASCCVLFLLCYELRILDKEYDDRPEWEA